MNSIYRALAATHSATSALAGGRTPLYWQRRLVLAVGDWAHLQRVSHWLTTFAAIALPLGSEPIFGRSLAQLTGAAQPDPQPEPARSQRAAAPSSASAGEEAQLHQGPAVQRVVSRSRSAPLPATVIPAPGHQQPAATAQRRAVPPPDSAMRQVDEARLRRAAGNSPDMRPEQARWQPALPAWPLATSGHRAEIAADAAACANWRQGLSQRAGQHLHRSKEGAPQQLPPSGAMPLAHEVPGGLADAWTRALVAPTADISAEQLAWLATSGEIRPTPTGTAEASPTPRNGQEQSALLGHTAARSSQPAAFVTAREQAGYAQAEEQSQRLPGGRPMASAELLARLAGREQMIQPDNQAGKQATGARQPAARSGYPAAAEATAEVDEDYRPLGAGRPPLARGAGLPAQERIGAGAAKQPAYEAAALAHMAPPGQTALLPPLRPPRQQHEPPLPIASVTAQLPTRQVEVLAAQDDLDLLATQIKQILDEEARRHGIAV